MPISFNRIPSNWRMPLYWVELDPSKAGLGQTPGRSVLVGIKLAAGTAVVDTPIPCASQAQADALFGQGSHLAGMFRAFFANNWANEVWGLPVAEPAGAPAVGTITVATAPTAAGTIDLYIAGRNVPVYVGATDPVATVATSIAAAITANTQTLPVIAVAALGVVTITAKYKGTSGNEIKLSDSYYGTVGGEMLPPGVTLTYVQPTGGTGDPLFTAAISNLGESEVDYICMPFMELDLALGLGNRNGFLGHRAVGLCPPALRPPVRLQA